MNTVVLVDATEEMRPLAAALEGAGYAVASRALADVLTGGDEETPAVLIFNLTGEAADGAAVRALLRAESMPHGIAAIALVRQGQLPGLDFSVGCDDFIVYPPAAEELAARVRRAI